MTTTVADRLPDDLYQAVLNLSIFAIPHRRIPAQVEAVEQLHHVFEAETIEQLVDTIKNVARAFRRDVEGKHIPDRLNGTVRRANMLIDELEQLGRSNARRVA